MTEILIAILSALCGLAGGVACEKKGVPAKIAVLLEWLLSQIKRGEP